MPSPSVTIPCPLCAASLTLSEENAGGRISCPACTAELSLPAFVDDSLRAAVLKAPAEKGALKPDSAKSTDAPKSVKPPGAVKPAVLPATRDKTAGEERRRQAAAIAGAPVDPSRRREDAPPDRSPAAGLPPDHPRTQLPVRRAVVDQTLSENIPAAGAPAARGPSGLPGPRGPLPGAASPGEPLKPIPVRGDVRISPSVLPASRRQTPQPEADAGQPGGAAGPRLTPRFVPMPPPEAPDEAAEETASPKPKGGHRLGGDKRTPVFAPFHEPAADAEKETASGGGGQSPEPPPRNRRLAAAALLAVLLAGAGGAVWGLKYVFQAPPPTAAVTSGEEQEQQEPLGNLAEARKVLQRFLSAATAEEQAREVRHPEQTLPRMRQHYAAAPLQPRSVKTEHDNWRKISAGDREFITGSLELDDLRSVNVALEIQPSGPLKVDWESYVNWAETPWRDFLKTSSENPVEFRVLISPANHYNHAFKERQADLFSFQIKDPENYASAWAYCGTDSEAGEKLHFHLRQARRQGSLNSERQPYIQCILRLRFPPEGLKTNQMMIEEFVQMGWVVP